MEPYLDEEDMEYVRLEDKGERHWGIFQDNDGEMDNEKSIIHAKRWDVYTNNKKVLIKVGYTV